LVFQLRPRKNSTDKFGYSPALLKDAGLLDAIENSGGYRES